MFSMAAIASGTVRIEIESKKAISLTPNSIIMFNPEQVHRSEFKTPATYGYYELYLCTSWCQKIQNKIFGHDLDYIDIDTNLLESEQHYKKFLTILNNILNDRKGKNFETVIKNFMSEIFENYCDINYISKRDNQYYNIINKARQFIMKNIDKDISLDRLSGYLGYSKSYVIRIFKNVYGQTPHAFIVNQKINRAKMLISMEERKTLGEIAKETGFYDQSHFTKNFKKIYGVNPKEYKK